MKAQKTTIKVIALSLAVAMFAALVGCTNSASPATTSESPTTTNATTTATNTTAELVTVPTSYTNTPPEEMVGKKDSFKGVTIGFSQRAVAGSSWYENLIRVAKAEAEHLGVKLVVADAQGNLAKQTSDIEDMMAQQVNSIIINPVDPAGILASTDKLHKANIPIINVNSQMDPKANPLSFVGHDTYSIGYAAGTALAEAYDAQLGNKKEIKAAILLGFPKELYSIYESNGMIAGFSQHFLDKYNKLNMNIVATRYGEWSADKALKQTDDILAANPDLDVLFTCDGIMLMGAMSAIQSAGLTGKVKLATVGGRKEEIKLIADPNSGVMASATADPRQEAKWAVYMAANAAKKNSVPPVFYIGSQGITSKNASSLFDEKSAY
jgi:ribose transport system substrate-binding protein